jgi:hypothetical protein
MHTHTHTDSESKIILSNYGKVDGDTFIDPATGGAHTVDHANNKVRVYVKWSGGVL